MFLPCPLDLVKIKDKKSKDEKKIKSLKMQPSPQFRGNNLKTDYNLIWNFDKSTKSLTGKDAGIGYLLYSIVLPNREKSYIKPDFNFNIELSSFDEDAFKQALASLWASIYLGGFGTRARRGGGNVCIESINGSNTSELDFILKGENSDEIGNWIVKNFENAKRFINSNNAWAFSYTNLCFSRFIISEKFFQFLERSVK